MIISKIILFYFLFGRQSVFPPILSMEPCRPVRHHIVVYLLAQTKEDHSTLNGRLRLHQEEVDAATWLDEETATQAAASDDFGQSLKVPQRYFRSVNRRRIHSNFYLAVSPGVLHLGLRTVCQPLQSTLSKKGPALCGRLKRFSTVA